MRHLTLNTPVQAPSGFTLAYLRTYFGERTQSGAGAAEFSLSLPLYALAAGRLSVKKPVTIEARYVSNAGAPDSSEVSWSPHGTMAIPSFAGTFATTASANGGCLLALTGTYAAPGGIAGAAFDALVGGNMARASIQGLLQELATATEADYRTRLAM